MTMPYLSSLTVRNLTAFTDMTARFSPGINVLLGEGGSGKSHFMKFLYAACQASLGEKSFPEKLTGLFMPLEGRIGRLVRKGGNSASGAIEIKRRRDGGEEHLLCSFDSRACGPEDAELEGEKAWPACPMESVFFPVKEMLAHAGGFVELHKSGRLAFDDTYADLIVKAMAEQNAPLSREMTNLAAELEHRIGGQIVERNGIFFLRSEWDDLEFSLLAEGLRKLGTLWRLIRNGTLKEGAVLFWDEPEANLSSAAIGPLMEIILAVRRMGVQVFLATHDYVVLKELDLRSKEDDGLLFHALFRNGRGIGLSEALDSPSLYLGEISQVFLDLYRRDSARALSETEEEP